MRTVNKERLWHNGKMTVFGKRMAALALALCFLVSFVQNIAFKSISAEETVSGSDVIFVDESARTESESDDVSAKNNATQSGTDVKSEVISASDAAVSDSEIHTDNVIALTADAQVDYSKLSADSGCTASILYYSGDWGVVYSGGGDGDSLVDGDGTYSVWFKPSAAASGANVFCVDIAGFSSYIEENTGKTIDDVVVSNVKVITDTTSIAVTQSNVLYGDLEDKGNLRIELYNTWGSTVNAPAIDLDSLSFSEMLKVEFTISGVGNQNDDATSDAEGESYIALTTTMAEGSQMNLWIIANDTVYIDWGDGNIVETTIDGYSKCTGTVAGTSIKVYCSGRITEFNCSGAAVTELDVSRCTGLVGLDCHSCSMEKLNVSGLASLESISCEDNKITELDISDCVNLKTLLAGMDNELESLDITNNSKLTVLECDNNYLRFSTMKGDFEGFNSDGQYSGGSIYSPQAKVEITPKANQINLSSEYEINGTKTVYTWYNAADDSVVTPTTSANGVFTFGEEFIGESLYCVMTNDVFPDLTLTTTSVEVVEEIDHGEPQIVFTTAKEIGETIKIDFMADDTVFVDWGDGNLVEAVTDEYSRCVGMLAGASVKIYCSGNITYFSCGMWTRSDTNEVISLNKITSLDISNAKHLKDLDCQENLITTLDVSSNTELKVLWCTGNEISELDLRNNANLMEVWCANNNLTNLDLSNKEYLYWVICSGNGLESVDVSGCTNLAYFDCYDNELDELDVSGNNLVTLKCINNNLRFSTMSSNIANFGYDPNIEESLGYAPQNNVNIITIVEANEEIDLSSEYDINGTITVYTWYNAADDSVVIPTTSANGVFTFGEDFIGESLYCTMTNDIFSDLTLTTTAVEIVEADSIIDADISVGDPEDYIGDVEIKEDSSFTDEDGNIYVDEEGTVIPDTSGDGAMSGNLHLIVGNVAENNKKTVLEAVEAYNDAFNADSDNYALYEIHLETSKGVKVTEINGRILICLKYPDNLGAECTDYTYNLYHQKNDGTIEEVEITCKPNGIWFYADEFSPFVLTWKLKNEVNGDSDSADVDSDNPATGDNSAMPLASCVFTISFAAMMSFAWYGIRRRRESEK